MKGRLKIEKAPTGRSRCHGCSSLIAKGSYRVLEIYYGRFTIKDKYCVNCGCTIINNTIKELKNMAETLKTDTERMILNEKTN